MLLQDPHTFYSESKKQFKYFKSPDVVDDPSFQQTSALYKSVALKSELDRYFQDKLHIAPKDAMDYSRNIWEVFEEKILSSLSLIYHRDFYPKYLLKAFENFLRDGVLVLEARMFLDSVHDDDGKPISFQEYTQMVDACVAEVRKREPLFAFKIIVQGLKVWDFGFMEAYLRKAFEARRARPDLGEFHVVVVVLPLQSARTRTHARNLILIY